MSHLDFARELTPELVASRRHLHRHPELGLQEFATTDYVADMLERWQVRFRRTQPTGIIAEIEGRRPGPIVALRGDMDALPITEETGLSYASETPGVMHACGHDGHTAMLLGAVRRIAAIDGDFAGTVRFLFQPGEEGHGGALKLIEQGALTGVKAIYGLHLQADTPLGSAAIRAGALQAAADFFTVRVQGKGGHGAKPEQTVDAVVVAMQIVGALQTIVSRRISPRESAVVTVGTFHAGSAANVIADSAEFSGTTRCFDADVRIAILDSIREIAEGVAQSLGASADVAVQPIAPPVLNHARETEILADAARRVLGAGQVTEPEPLMASEDYAHYLEQVPGAYLFLGAKTEGLYPHHHPKFTIDEAALPYGTAILCTAAMSELGE